MKGTPEVGVVLVLPGLLKEGESSSIRRIFKVGLVGVRVGLTGMLGWSLAHFLVFLSVLGGGYIYPPSPEGAGVNVVAYRVRRIERT